MHSAPGTTAHHPQRPKPSGRPAPVPARPPPRPPAAPAAPASPARLAARLGDALTSLKLTITCLSALMALVVGCTLAQVEQGTWGAVETFMRSWFVRVRVPGVGVPVPVFPGGVLVGLVLAVNLVAAQGRRLQRSWKKAGIWLTHAGLIVLLAGEFVTGAFQVDAQLSIEEGQTAHYVERSRELELAIVDVTEPAHDDVYAIPGSLLARGGSIRIPGTPLSLRVMRFMRNAEFAERREADVEPVVTAGAAVGVTARELPLVTTDDRQDRAAAFVEPIAGGTSLGTWLVSNALATPQSFVHAGRTYALSLRPRREYLPYSLTLRDFRHEVHAGTDVPKSFSSLVHLSNPSTGEARDVLISMNQPLRHAGKTFYQASFGKGGALSVLQVVENPGWLLPYASAALVTLGLLVHFGISLGRGARRATGAAPPPVAARPAGARARLGRLAPWLAGATAAGVALASALPRGDTRGFDLEAFRRLPVLEGGRVKPIDSVARNALLTLRGQQGFRHEGRRVAAEEWLLDVLFRPAVADVLPVFRVDDPGVLALAGLPQGAGRYHSAKALAPHASAIAEQAASARRLDPRQRTRFQAAVVNLYDRLFLYHRLRHTVQLAGTPLASEISARGSPAAPRRHEALRELAFFRPLVPASPTGDAWRSTGEALAAGGRDLGLDAWARMSAAWSGGEPGPFDRAVRDLHALAALARPEALSLARHESLFNAAQPFYAGMVAYVLALLALFASWLRWPALLRRVAFGLLAGGAVVHTAGLVARVVLQGRPPVTNLYSSAVFVGWVTVVLGLVLERVHRRGLATGVAAATGFASLIVAHHLTGSGDTMEMMRAVLDSNFWLATHVVAITLGYGATFLAGALGIAWVGRRHLARRGDPATGKTLASMTYGVLCFGLLFSFVGTVLGGIWADQSWGRFWGWDPKENGALLIVLWNATIVHARWAGYARERGIAAMAIFGNVITSLSWFGVNMLGVGLHSYGFMDQAFWSLSGFVASQLVLLALAFVPPSFWRPRANPVAA
jgi:ABC-type transport system involved in cytochrome c biogenesis permease subunit